jgi:uncharacterized protein YqjF (DUF2071 family)
MGYLQNHPFAVEAYFKSSIVLTFAVPKQEIQHLIPECLELDTFQDQWAFVAVALVDTTQLRPKGFPSLLGNNFKLIGYRIFVRYINNNGKRLRGLYILKSETDKKKMEFLGSIFTKYNYATTDISISDTENATFITSQNSKLHIEIDRTAQETSLPSDSPFADWKEARRFAGPLPFTFTYNKANQEVLIIEGVRENWTPQPLKISNFSIGFIENLGAKKIVLANAFEIKDIPYYWKKGKIEKWNPTVNPIKEF